MANTVIQIKRSTVTTAPTAGSLSAAEPAYSYLSDKLFIGSSDGSQVIEIGGRYYVNATIASFNQANIANSIAISAYDKANAANLLAYSTNNFLLSVIAGANVAVGAGANAYADLVGQGANNYMITVQNGSNTAVGAGANAYTNAFGVIVGQGANSYADGTFIKRVSPNQIITGNIAVTGSLTVSGNAYTIDTETLKISDPLIYLAGNNYLSDIVDIGFVGNYNTGSANLHTGIFRDATVKEYFVFDGYDQEPNPNHIDTSANGFTLAVLNATIRTSNLILNGANAITTINNVGVAANAYADLVGQGANNYMITVQNGSNTAVGQGANAYASAAAVGANNYLLSVIAGANTAVGAGANSYADLVGQAANTNAANASYLSTGTVPSARISGSYTGITGVGTITAGIWNGTTITVPYGGTGMTSFTSNGILYGNTTGSLKVTAAGTEGQVLQASAAGIPSFGMLDGGIF